MSLYYKINSEQFSDFKCQNFQILNVNLSIKMLLESTKILILYCNESIKLNLHSENLF